MNRRIHKRGFTFIEILVVIAIILILAAVAVVTFKNLDTTSSHRVVTQEVYSTLTEAHNNSIASTDDSVYGVHFETDLITLFEGDTYNASDSTNKEFVFTGGVYATSSLITNSVDIVFKRLTGFPTATGALHIVRSDGSATSTITIHGTGLIEK